MAVPKLFATITRWFSTVATSTAKGDNSLVTYETQTPSADINLALSDQVTTTKFGQQGTGGGYGSVNDIVSLLFSTLGLSAPLLFFLAGIEDTLTAGVGGTQANAIAFSATKAVHRITTVASANDSFKLPLATGSGSVHFVMNSAAANSAQIFGAGTDTINDVAAATGVAQAAGKGAIYVDIAAGKWYRALGA